MAEKSHKQKGVKTRSRAGKVENQTIAQGEMYSASFGVFPFKNRITFQIQELRKNCENREVL